MANDANTQTINTADFTETPRLVLEQPVGDIKIQGWDRPAIEVSDRDGKGNFDVSLSGSQVTVRNMPKRVRLNEVLEPAVRELNNIGVNAERMASRVERQVERSMRHMRRGMNFNIDMDLGRWTGSADYRINVPHHCDLMLRTSSGDIYITNVNGTLFVESTSGDVDMQQVGGTLLVNTSSGDLNLRDVEGKLALRSISGDITIERGDLQELGVHTSSGDIRATLTKVPDREFQVRTVSGDLNLILPADARLTAEMNTVSGDLHCAFPHEIVKRSGRRDSTLRINGGGISAQFSSVSGDVRLRPTPGSTAAPAPASTGEPTMDLSRQEDSAAAGGDLTEPEGDTERRAQELSILQALERGDITSQEALQHLSELGR